MERPSCRACCSCQSEKHRSFVQSTRTVVIGDGSRISAVSIRAYRRAIKCFTTCSRESDNVDGSDLLHEKHNVLGTVRAVATLQCRDGDGSSESAGTTAAEVSQQGCGAPRPTDNKPKLF